MAAPSMAVSMQRQREDLQAAMLQLFRSIGALRSDQQLRFNTRIPLDWSPFAALVGKAPSALHNFGWQYRHGIHLRNLLWMCAGLCLQLAKDPANDGRRSMADSMAAVPRQLVESVAFLDAFMLEGSKICLAMSWWAGKRGVLCDAEGGLVV